MKDAGQDHAAGKAAQGAAARSPRTPAPKGLLLDLTRSINRAKHQTLSGIDRVERAYLDWMLASSSVTRLYLCRLSDGWRLLDRAGAVAVSGFLDGGYEAPALDLRARMSLVKPPRARAAETLVRRHTIAHARSLAQLAPAIEAAFPEGGVYLNVGHDNLAPEVTGAIREGGLAPVVLLHDVIPMDYPEFARPGGAAQFRTRLEAAAEAALIVTNSRYTAERVTARMTAEGLSAPPVHANILGIGEDLLRPPGIALPGEDGPERPVFVQIGTIEPRKNHLMVLNLWRRMWDQRHPDRTPHLHIVGRRGWENEQVLDMLDRAPMMGRTVFEHADLDDEGAARLLDRARALLLPSLVEGFGLPLGEALMAGVPVIAADLPPHREVGREVPELLDPLDGPAWLAAIDDYARDESPRRAAQLSRLAGWQAPRWADHFAELERLLPAALDGAFLSEGAA